MIVDAHCHIGNSIYGWSQNVKQILSYMKLYGIDKSVLIPFTPPDLDFKKTNDFVARIARKYPGKFVGFARVDPRQVQSASKELRRSVTKLGHQGAKLHPLEQGFQVNSDTIQPVFETLSDLKIPVLLAAGLPIVANVVQIEEVAESFPKIPIIMAHGAQIDGSGLGQFDAKNAMKGHSNLYAETSGIPETGKDGFFSQLKAIGVGMDRVIFGSCSPKMHPKVEIDRIVVSPLSPEEREAILGRNILSILGVAD